MTERATIDAYGALIEPATLKIQRLLPGPVERVWAWLTESDKRRKWLASGEMEMKVGAPFELVWRNGELAGGQGGRPEGYPEEHRMESRITELRAPYRLSFTWGETGEVTMDLDPQGDDVLLTLVHKRISDRPNTLMIGAGWHAHLDVLVAEMRGETPEPFWDNWLRLKEDYDRRLPA
jgi:uncharacterized protein YndB with AHSA1/START domain